MLLGRGAAGALSCPAALSAQHISSLFRGAESSPELQPKTKSFLISLRVWAWVHKSGCWKVSSTRCSQPGPPQPIADQLKAVLFCSAAAARLRQVHHFLLETKQQAHPELFITGARGVYLQKNINTRLLLSWSFTHQQLSEQES